MAEQIMNNPLSIQDNGGAPIGGENTMAPEQTGQMDEQSMRQDIERSLEGVKSQNNALETNKFISKNKMKKFKVDMLRDIYAMLQEMGVDPSNPNSIKNFLMSLEQQDPDLLTLFETIFEVLSPDNVDDTSEQSNISEQPLPEAGLSGEGMLMPEPGISGEEMPMPEAVPPAMPTEQQNPGADMPTGGGGGGPEQGGQNLMDKFSNLQEGILRQ